MAESHNGWTNYETWRIKLEIFDSTDSRELEIFDSTDFWEDVSDASAEFCRDLVEQHIEQESNGLARDYALAFIANVNWHEIADSLNREEGGLRPLSHHTYVERL